MKALQRQWLTSGGENEVIEMKIKNRQCELKVIGEQLDCIAEAAVGYMELTEAVAKAGNMSFESAALLLYQNVMQVYSRHKNEKE